MIETLTVPLGRFDLEGVIETYRAFFRRWSGIAHDPDASLSALERFGETPTPLAAGRNLSRSGPTAG